MAIFSVVKPLEFTLSSIYIPRRTRVARECDPRFACYADRALHRERQLSVFRISRRSLVKRKFVLAIRHVSNRERITRADERPERRDAPGVTCDVRVASIRAPIVNQLRILDRVPRPPFAVVASSRCHGGLSSVFRRVRLSRRENVVPRLKVFQNLYPRLIERRKCRVSSVYRVASCICAFNSTLSPMTVTRMKIL